ncbi:diguanylate cyclase [Paraglaciecola sp. 2405UD69-4]|uniref:diguanylate cyclase n=1 Tax=Paraglaciecola sp. 2405UD69-4 TaxID=3391836 RepID=UPI0039C9B43D
MKKHHSKFKWLLQIKSTILIGVLLCTLAYAKPVAINKFDNPYAEYVQLLTTQPSKILEKLQSNPIADNDSQLLKAQYYGLLSQAHYTLIYPEKALESAQLSLTYITEAEQPWLYHTLKVYEAMAFELIGQPIKGIEGLKHAITWSNQNKALDIYAMALYTKSLINTKLGHYTVALESAKAGYALKAHPQNGYKRHDFTMLIAQIYDELDEYRLAIPVYEEAVAEFRARNQLVSLSIALYGLGRANYAIHKADSGVEQLEESLSIAETVGDSQGVAYALAELALINIKQGNYSLAKQHLLAARKIFSEARNPLVNIESSMRLALVSLHQQNTSSAKQYLDEARALLVKENMPSHAIEIDYIRSKLLFQNSDYKAAYELLSSVYDNYRNYREQESNSQLHKTRVEYDLQSKELQNDILSEKNALQQQELKFQKNKNIYFFIVTFLAIGASILMAVLVYRTHSHRKVLEVLATTDELTGLCNRRHILEHLNKTITATAKTNGCSSVAMIDLDWFKKINDNFGHATGDLVLQKFSQICLQTMPKNAHLGRIGGEEFLMLFPNTDAQNALIYMNKLRHKMPALTKQIDIPNLKITASIGIYQWDQDDTAKDIMQKADIALYKAKENGRNQVLNYQPSLGE